MKNRWIALAGLAAAIALPGAVQAQSTWNLISGGGCTQNAANSGNFGNSWACTGTGNGGTNLTAYAYSTQVGSGGTLQTINAGTQWANAFMSSQGNSGFGTANRTEGLGVAAPDHAVDNNPTGSYDMIVLNFGTAVILDQIGIGWGNTSNMADLTIMRWTGAGAPDSGTGAVQAGGGGNSTLTRSGWTLVSSLADVLGDNTNPIGQNARNTYASAASSWWMIAAFNTTLNTGNSCYTNNSGGTVAESTAANTTAKCDDGDDAFKLNWLKTSVAGGGGSGGQVPEPASLALVAAALVGLRATRRRAA